MAALSMRTPRAPCLLRAACSPLCPSAVSVRALASALPPRKQAGSAKTSSAKTSLPSATSLTGKDAAQAASRLSADPMTGESLGLADIEPSRLVIEDATTERTPPPASELVFGRTFTDHMLCIPWNATTGWSPPRIQPYAPLSLDPSATVFHYAPCLFEGMKAYKDAEGQVRLFRPDKNMERMNNSAARLAFPTFTGSHLVELIRKLVSLDKRWIPSEPGHSLYIRPSMIGTQAGLGVGPSTDVLLFVICSPVGPYYKSGFKPVSLLATTEHVRAWPGGTGGYKLGSNYAGGVVPQVQAAELGYAQILWLFGEDHELTEVGTMNLFAVFSTPDGGIELVTPPLQDVILPGVTRDSILSLARAHSDAKNPLKLEGLPPQLKVTERRLTMPEIVKASADGSLREMFGSGTAAVVSPVESIGYQGKKVPVPVGADGLGDVARAVLKQLQGIQMGEIESDWAVLVD